MRQSTDTVPGRRALHRLAGWLLGSALAIASLGLAGAPLYRSVDADGNVIFTDVPPSQDAQPLELPPVNVMEPVKVPPPAPPTRAPAAAAIAYSLAIVQPLPDTTIRDNRGALTVVVALQPGLQAGHQLTISVDGRPLARGADTRVTLSGIERGSHRLTASVTDQGGNPVITSAPVTVHVKRTSTLHPRPTAP